MQEFYVYTLIDPRNNQVFYVGKGKRNRSISHITETVKNNNNSTKYIKIQNILDLGLQVGIEKVFEDLEEAEALLLEKILIETLGRIVLKNGALANIIPGGAWSKDITIYAEEEFDLEHELIKIDSVKRTVILDINRKQNEVKKEYPLDYNMKSVKASEPRTKGLSLADLQKKKNELLNE